LMRLADLFPDHALSARDADVAITGLSCDSRTIGGGDVFFAVPGTRGDGLAYADAALAAGASALVCQDAQISRDDVAIIRVANVRLAMAQAAARFYPRQPAVVLAVTGTSGKTSVASFVRQIFAHHGVLAAALGTTGVVAPSGHHYGALTTPDPITLHRLCDKLAGEGVTHLALEASSHGLDQFRLDGLRLTAGAFTNLSRDHLDYHATMADYLNAKLGLFRRLLQRGQSAIIHADDVYSHAVIDTCQQAGLHVLTTGRLGNDIILRQCELRAQSAHIAFEYEGTNYQSDLALTGDFMIANVLVAMGLCVAGGLDIERIVAALPYVVGAPGRLERVADNNGAPIYVDYAHKPDALEKVLLALRPMVTGRLILVFGCGGDRDRGKRGEMGSIAQRLADVVIVTDDNPRSEDPVLIRAAICAQAPDALSIADRAEAIGYAIHLAHEGDVVLIAGKGHEQGQIIGTQIIPFSDHDVVRSYVKGAA
jgi:UDP-N-acetylmuramoyl-L-alanyl-D-glutamate--2,6-diaminopimelate ligase